MANQEQGPAASDPCRHPLHHLLDRPGHVDVQADHKVVLVPLRRPARLWLTWARRSRIRSFVKLAKTISQHYQGIVATLTHRLSNARIEAINTTLRLICRRAYGFHSADALIALAMLTVGGLRPSLPGRLPNPWIR
jgi:hypothetical protein